MNGIGADRTDERGSILRSAHPLELRTRALEATGDAEALRLLAVPDARQKLRQASKVPLP